MTDAIIATHAITCKRCSTAVPGGQGFIWQRPGVEGSGVPLCNRCSDKYRAKLQKRPASASSPPRAVPKPRHTHGPTDATSNENEPPVRSVLPSKSALPASAAPSSQATAQHTDTSQPTASTARSGTERPAAVTTHGAAQPANAAPPKLQAVTASATEATPQAATPAPPSARARAHTHTHTHIDPWQPASRRRTSRRCMFCGAAHTTAWHDLDGSTYSLLSAPVGEGAALLCDSCHRQRRELAGWEEAAEAAQLAAAIAASCADMDGGAQCGAHTTPGAGAHRRVRRVAREAPQELLAAAGVSPHALITAVATSSGKRRRSESGHRRRSSSPAEDAGVVNLLSPHSDSHAASSDGDPSSDGDDASEASDEEEKPRARRRPTARKRGAARVVRPTPSEASSSQVTSQNSSRARPRAGRGGQLRWSISDSSAAKQSSQGSSTSSSSDSSSSSNSSSSSSVNSSDSSDASSSSGNSSDSNTQRIESDRDGEDPS